MTDDNKCNDITEMSIEISLTLFFSHCNAKLFGSGNEEKKRTYLKAMFVSCRFAQ